MISEGVSVTELVKATGGQLEGAAPTGPLTQLLDPRQEGYASLAQQGVVVLADGAEPPTPPPALLVLRAGSEVKLGEQATPALLWVQDTRLALARVTRLFSRAPLPGEGWEEGVATVHPSAVLGPGVSLAPGAVVGPGARVGDGCSLGAGTVIGAGVILGEGCQLHPNVTLYPGTTLGKRVSIHSGAVIGADGFGYAAGPVGAEKIHHLGGVVVGDDVEIGANTAIDRGTLLNTTVGARSKIDNHCQIGHNVQIGTDTLIAGMSGVAGSAVIGNGVIIGGYVAVSDHVKIGDGARIGGRSGVTKSVPAGEAWAGFPAKPQAKFVRELYLLSRLERVWQAVRGLPGKEE